MVPIFIVNGYRPFRNQAAINQTLLPRRLREEGAEVSGIAAQPHPSTRGRREPYGNVELGLESPTAGLAGLQ